VFFTIINPLAKYETKSVSEEKPDQSEEFILEYEGFRAKIDTARPQQAICLIFGQRVNNARLLREQQERRLGQHQSVRKLNYALFLIVQLA